MSCSPRIIIDDLFLGAERVIGMRGGVVLDDWMIRDGVESGADSSFPALRTRVSRVFDTAPNSEASLPSQSSE